MANKKTRHFSSFRPEIYCVCFRWNRTWKTSNKALLRHFNAFFQWKMQFFVDIGRFFQIKKTTNILISSNLNSPKRRRIYLRKKKISEDTRIQCLCPLCPKAFSICTRLISYFNYGIKLWQISLNFLIILISKQELVGSKTKSTFKRGLIIATVLAIIVGVSFAIIYYLNRNGESSTSPRVPISLNDFLENKLYVNRNNATWLSPSELTYRDIDVSICKKKLTDVYENNCQITIIDNTENLAINFIYQIILMEQFLQARRTI